MSTTGTEKHCRLCLMLSKGGTKACYHLLLKRVEELSPVDHQPNPWTVQQFLESKKDAIKTSKLSKEKFDVLFPRHGATELTKWDLSLFCKVLTLYCNLKLLIRQDIEQLLRMRNDLCHMNEPSVTDVQFKDYLETIQVTVSRIMQDINNQMVKSEIDKDMDQLENGPLALNETLREMRTFYLMEFDINKKLEHVIDVNETVLKKIEKLDDRLELIYSRPGLKDSSTLVAARNNFLLPGLDIFLDLNNVSEDEETEMSIVLEKLFEEVINEDKDFRSSIPAESYVRLREAVKRLFQLFLSKGWRITHTKHACIQLHIRCTNFKSLAALFREQIHGHIDHLLTYLNEALNECFNRRNVRLETTIYKDEFWNVIDKSSSCVEEFLTKHNIDSVNPNDNEDIFPGDSRHTLSLSAEKVRPESRESSGAMANNELETCLQLLRSELKSEFYVPHLSIIANCSSIVDHESYNLCSDDKVEIPGEQEKMQTIRTNDHQSEERESTKTLKDEKGEYVERIMKELTLKEIEPTTGTRVKQKEHSGEEKEITGQTKMDVSPAIPLAISATDSKEASIWIKMSTTGTERHCRLCLMLNKGGTQACHHLLLKRVKELCPKDHDPYPWTVQQFLDTKKQTIIKSKLSNDKFKILFPNDGDTVLTKWDLSLFCTVLTLYCALKPVMRLDVEQLRNLRNELCHMNVPNISVSDYKDKLEIIQVIICRLVQQIDEHNVKIEIENVIKNLESATLSLDETLKEMHAFYMMEMDIREKLYHVEESILQKLEQFGGKWEFISKVLGEKEDSRINTATNNDLVPDSSIGNKVELPEENTQTIRSDHQSPKFDKKEKEIIKTFKDEDGEYDEGVFKELSLKDIEQQQMGTLVKQEEHSSGKR